MKKTTFLIVGKHAVLEALKNPNRKIERIFLTEDAQKKLNKENQSLNLFKKLNVFYKSRKELDNLCGRDETSHQGLVAEVEQLEEITLKEFIIENKKKNINLLALDEVTDPRNIGSIIRSAVAFNLDGLVVKERSFPSKSKLLYKSASGGAEHLKIFKVANLNTSLKFDVTGEKNFITHNWEGKNVLVFGSEGMGLKKNTLKNSDFTFKIEINKTIESLNVSNSVSVVAHYINTIINKR